MIIYKSSAKYKLIKDYNVPADEYISVITDAYETTTHSNVPVLDICYIICSSVAIIDCLRGKIPKKNLQRYYVKERIPLNSTYMDAFNDILHNKYDFPEKFDPSELVDLSELFRIRYNNRDFGEIYNRRIWTDEDTDAYIEYIEEKEAERAALYAESAILED